MMKTILNILYSAVAHQEQKVIRNWCDKCGLIKVSQIWKHVPENH